MTIKSAYAIVECDRCHTIEHIQLTENILGGWLELDQADNLEGKGWTSFYPVDTTYHFCPQCSKYIDWDSAWAEGHNPFPSLTDG